MRVSRVAISYLIFFLVVSAQASGQPSTGSGLCQKDNVNITASSVAFDEKKPETGPRLVTTLDYTPPGPNSQHGVNPTTGEFTVTIGPATLTATGTTAPSTPSPTTPTTAVVTPGGSITVYLPTGPITIPLILATPSTTGGGGGGGGAPAPPVNCEPGSCPLTPSATDCRYCKETAIKVVDLDGTEYQKCRNEPLTKVCAPGGDCIGKKPGDNCGPNKTCNVSGSVTAENIANETCTVPCSCEGLSTEGGVGSAPRERGRYSFDSYVSGLGGERSATGFINRGGEWYWTDNHPVMLINIFAGAVGREMIWYLNTGAALVWEQLPNGAYRLSEESDPYNNIKKYFYESNSANAPITEIREGGLRLPTRS